MQIGPRRSCNEREGRQYVAPAEGAEPVAVDIFWQNDPDKPEGWCWSLPDIADIADVRVADAGYVTSVEALNYAKVAMGRYFDRNAVAARKEKARNAEAARKAQARQARSAEAARKAQARQARSAEAAQARQARSAEAALRDRALRERDCYIGAHSYGEDCKGFFIVKPLQGRGWRWADARDGSWSGLFGSSRAAYMAARASRIPAPAEAG